MEWLDECRYWLRGGCVGAEGSAVMDGDWPSEVTKLQLENNGTDPNHIAVSDHIIGIFIIILFSFCILVFCHLKIGRFLAVEKDIKFGQVGVRVIYIQLYKVRNTEY